MERQHAVADRPVYGKCWQLAKLVSRLDGGVKILHYTADWNGLILKGHIVDTLLFLLLAASLLFFFSAQNPAGLSLLDAGVRAVTVLVQISRDGCVADFVIGASDAKTILIRSE